MKIKKTSQTGIKEFLMQVIRNSNGNVWEPPFESHFCVCTKGDKIEGLYHSPSNMNVRMRSSLCDDKYNRKSVYLSSILIKNKRKCNPALPNSEDNCGN